MSRTSRAIVPFWSAQFPSTQLYGAPASVRAFVCPFIHARKSILTIILVNQAGKVNLCSPDHISLLVHRTFNVSIPRHHIPTDEWEFEYGPAENDPEFGKADGQEHEATMAEDGHEIDHSSGGKWVNRTTGEALGGQDGVLQFTVIGCVCFGLFSWLDYSYDILDLLWRMKCCLFLVRYNPTHSLRAIQFRMVMQNHKKKMKTSQN